jgi:putative membrane protein
MLTVLLTFVRGFAMGAADIVPGVSGGTVALVLGIYERLIASVRAGSSALGALLRVDGSGSRGWFGRVEWSFILPLGVGILSAIVLLAHLIEDLLVDQPVAMAAAFLGLVAGSVVIALRLLRRPERRHLLIIGIVGIVVFALLGLQGGTSEDTVTQISEPTLLAFFLAGSVAICAMILPGVSGSFLLVVLGMYGAVLGAVTSRDFVSLGVFAIGAIVGLALFAQVLDRALHSHHDTVLAVLIGLMAGSVRVLWPWPGGVNSTDLGAPTGEILIPLIVAAIGFAVVVVVGGFAQRLEESTHPAEPD